MKKIAIIGAGPFGLIALSKLIKRAVESKEAFEIFIFDPYGPGGNVWRSDQSKAVIMNTVLQHVTLFSEDEGPNLGEWSQREAAAFLATLDRTEQEKFMSETRLAKNDYCSRRYYGIYQRWFYAEILKKTTKKIQVHLVKEKITDLTLKKEKISLIGSKEYLVSDVILATGHSQNEASEEECENQNFAQKNNLFYQRPGNPANTPLKKLVNGPIIIRGLGLSFYDYLPLLIDKWGGKFIEKEGNLRYQPSGKEAKIIVGSGRGLPYHARPINQKEPGEDAKPEILTLHFMSQFQGSVKELVTLVKKEAELVYYQKVLKDVKFDLTNFLTEYRCKDAAAVLKKYRVPKELQLNWEQLLQPAGNISPEHFPSFVLGYLKSDIKSAELGNKTGAIASAIDTFKELQAPFDYMLDHEKFSEREYYEDFWGDFNRSYSFLAIGAPVVRQKQLAALVEAEIVEFLAPEMTVTKQNGQFVAYSKQDEKRRFNGKNLIEARLPQPSFATTKNPLLKNMREKGYLAPHKVTFDAKSHVTGAILVSRKTHQIIDNNGQIQPHLFCYGIPLEGLDWLNAASPRPKSNDRVFYLADQIIETIFAKKR